MLHLNDKVDVTFEIDTGSYVSTLCRNDALRANAVIRRTAHKALAYGGACIKLLGECNISINLNDNKIFHKFLVVDNGDVNLFGRDLCDLLDVKLSLPTNNVENIYNVSNFILNKYSNYLSDAFKSNIKEKVSLEILNDCKPVFSKARNVPVKMKNLVENELSRLVSEGILTKVFRSDWASPTVNILKKNGTIRLCGDFSATINQVLNPVSYPLPSIDEVISQMNNSIIFSKLDLSNAYLQLPLDDHSKQFTTINTCEGLFQFNYLPYGLTASSGIFQSFMSKILNGVNGVIIYQDDILVHSSSNHEHDSILDKVLSILMNAGVKLNSNKCDFFVNKVEYLGHIFDANGVHPNPNKLKAIMDAPEPKNVRQVQAFIGLCNYYSRFINSFSTKMAPLYSLLKKNNIFRWDSHHQNCFDSIKSLFKNADVLKIFDSNKETLLETDSSSYGVAAVLMQRDNHNGMWTPVEFASRSLNSSEKNYSNLEREALSVIFGITKFRKYLLGMPFIIHNDQQPLRKLLAHGSNVPLNCSARVQRWALKLSQFNYEFVYSKGANNVNSDCLSRIPLEETEQTCDPYELIFSINSIDSMPITSVDIKNLIKKDKNLNELLHYIKYGWPNKINNPELKYFQNKISELSLFDGCIMYGNRVFIPVPLRKIVLNQLHDSHPGICAMKSIARSIIWYPKLDDDIENLVKSCKECQINASKPKKTFVNWQVPKRPWSRVHIDHFFLDNHICLVAADTLSRYIEVEIVKNVSAEETIEALRMIFSRNGICDVIVSDNATSFTAQTVQEFFSK